MCEYVNFIQPHKCWSHTHTIPSTFKRKHLGENKESPWRFNMNYSIHQTRGQTENESETWWRNREREVDIECGSYKETGRWTDKDSGVLYCISSNNDRDIEKVVNRFLINLLTWGVFAAWTCLSTSNSQPQCLNAAVTVKSWQWTAICLVWGCSSLCLFPLCCLSPLISL